LSKGVELRLEIAELCCQIECQSQRFLELLKCRYHGFLSEKTPLFSINALVNDSHNSNNQLPLAVRSPKAEIAVKGGRVIMGGTDFSGEFNSDINKAFIHLPCLIHPFDWFLRLIYSYYLIKENGFFIHATAIVRHELGYVFFGPSGSGKSTIAALSDGAQIGDELVVIKKAGDQYRIFGTPFWQGHNRNVLLQGLFKLQHGDCVSIDRLSPARAIYELMTNIEFGLQSSELIKDFFWAVTDLVDVVECCNMQFLPNNSFWEHIIKAS
jgi:hypothetical protein